MRLVFLGDSLTWGGYGGNYVVEVAQLLPEHEIINAGVGGNTIVNLLERLEPDVIDHEPGGVFVMVGGNDSTSYTQPKTRPYYEQVQGIPDGYVDPETFAQAYRELLSQLQLAHIQTWIGLPPKEYNPVTVQAGEDYNAIAGNIARSFNVPTLDLMAYFKPNHIPERPDIDMGFINLIGRRVSSGWADFAQSQAEGNFTYTFDGLHFTPEAAREAAELIVEWLQIA